MLAVDTNVLVRFFTRDDAHQAKRAARTLIRGEIWLSKTVLLETEWVLRSTYGFTPDQVISALRALLGAENVFVEESIVVAEALQLADDGMDLADALHIASAGPSQRFATFDSKLVRKARRRTKIEVIAV